MTPIEDIDRSSIQTILFGWSGTLINDISGMQRCLVEVIGGERSRIDLEAMALAWRKEIWRAMQRRYEPWPEMALLALRRTCQNHGFRWSTWRDFDLPGWVARWPVYDDSLLVGLLPRRKKTGVLSQLDAATLGPCLPTLTTRFDYLFTSDRVRAYKPAEGFYSLLPTQLPPNDPKSVIVISADPLEDLEPSKALGYQTLQISHDEDDEHPSLGEAIQALRNI